MKVFILISTLVSLTFASNSLGPVRSCRCFDAHEYALSSSVHTSPYGFGPPMLCHCLPTSTSFSTSVFNSKPSLNNVQHPSMFYPSTVRSPGVEYCSDGLGISGTYTVDDTAELKMCNNHVSTGSLNQLINIDLKESSYSCGDFKFELKNDKYSSGLSFAVQVNGYKFVAVGEGSPSLPPGVTALKTYAKWGLGTCDGSWPGPYDKAVYVSSLDGTNDAFNKMKTYGSYPVGVQNGDVYEKGLQCIIIENPFCYHPTRQLRM